MLYAVWTALTIAVAPPPGVDGVPTAPPAIHVLVPVPENQDPIASHAESAPQPGSAQSPNDGGNASAVPEPSTLLLVGTGLLGLAISRRWRRATR